MNRLLELRERALMTQARLGQLTDACAQQIGRLERGERKLTVEWAKRLAPALGVSWEAVLAEPKPSAAASDGSKIGDQLQSPDPPGAGYLVKDAELLEVIAIWKTIPPMLRPLVKRTLKTFTAANVLKAAS